jgi:hypothetical protein
MRNVHARSNNRSVAPNFIKAGVRIFQPESSNRFAPKQSHVPVIRRPSDAAPAEIARLLLQKS